MTIRVLHIITRMILGGAQENTLLTVEGLMKKPRYDVLLATGPAIGPEGELLERARRNNVPLKILPSLRRNILPWHDLQAFLDIYRLMSEWQPDVVHTHSSKAGILGRLAASMQDVENIVHTIHGLPFHPYQSRLEFHAYAGLERWAGSISDRLLVVCNAMKEQALEAGVGTPDRYRLVYSGMEMDPFLTSPPESHLRSFRRSLGIQKDEKMLVKISRIAPLKGHRFVFEMLPDLLEERPDVQFVFVGDGTLRKRFEKQANEHGWGGRVHFTGLVDPQRIPLLLHAADLVVHASLREGLARVLPQSLLTQTPVVTFDLDGAPEVVENGETGWLVPPEDSEALRNAVLDVLSNPEEARRRAQKGKEVCKERFSHKKMVKAIDQIYRETVESTQ